MREAAYVTTWAEVQVGDTILISWPATWRTVTEVQVKKPSGGPPSRYLRTDNLPYDGYREYWAWDDAPVTVKA